MVEFGRFLHWLKGSPQTRKKHANKLFIHAGTYKTGTSSLQGILYHNTDFMKEHGILYPADGLGLNTEHNRFSHRILGLNLAAGRTNYLPKIAQDILASPTIDKALVSYEGFGHPHNLPALVKALESIEDIEFHGILVFRPHIDFALSFYRELCQNIGYTKHFREFVNFDSDDAGQWQETLNYRKIVEAWQQAFGKNRVHLLSYSNIQKDVAGGVLSVLGDIPALKIPDTLERNRTISAPCAELMRRLNQHPMPITTRQFIGKMMHKLDARHTELRDYVEILKDDALRLESRFQADREFLRKYGFGDTLSLQGRWKWGMDTCVGKHVRDLQGELIDELKAADRTDLADTISAITL